MREMDHAASGPIEVYSSSEELDELEEELEKNIHSEKIAVIPSKKKKKKKTSVPPKATVSRVTIVSSNQAPISPRDKKKKKPSVSSLDTDSSAMTTDEPAHEHARRRKMSLIPSGRKPQELLFVSLVRGKNLPGKGGLGLSDPYVIFHLKAGKQFSLKSGKTTTKTKTRNPVWRQDFVFRLPRREKIGSELNLVMVIKDANVIMKNEEIGRIILPLKAARPWDGKLTWLPVGRKHDGTISKDRGALLIRMRFNYKLPKKEDLKTRLFKNNHKLFTKMNKVITTWNECKDSLQTGDIVLFSSVSIPGKIIRFFTRSQWSHVCMVYMRDGEPWTFEAIPEGGVCSHPLTKWLKDAHYNKIAVRRLLVERTPQLLECWRLMWEEFKGRPYEESHLKLIKSSGLGINPDNLAEVFCSELIAEAYMRAGIFERGTSASNYTPEDFTSRKMNVRKGKLAVEVYIQRFLNLRKKEYEYDF